MAGVYGAVGRVRRPERPQDAGLSGRVGADEDVDPTGESLKRESGRGNAGKAMYVKAAHSHASVAH